MSQNTGNVKIVNYEMVALKLFENFLVEGRAHTNCIIINLKSIYPDYILQYDDFEHRSKSHSNIMQNIFYFCPLCRSTVPMQKYTNMKKSTISQKESWRERWKPLHCFPAASHFLVCFGVSVAVALSWKDMIRSRTESIFKGAAISKGEMGVTGCSTSRIPLCQEM